MSLMMIEYEGRMMSTDEVLRLKNSKKEVLELAKQEYFNIFGKKPNPNIKLETLREKISQASI